MMLIYWAFGALNFVALMCFFVYRCLYVHKSKTDIETCLFWGFMGALFAGLLGFMATFAISVTVGLLMIIDVASTYIHKIKLKDK